MDLLVTEFSYILVKVNIDAEHLKEVPLNQKNLFDCAGPCSLCMEFCDVINICLPDSGQRRELMNNQC